jgi:hypothetical protein
MGLGGDTCLASGRPARVGMPFEPAEERHPALPSTTWRHARRARGQASSHRRVRTTPRVPHGALHVSGRQRLMLHHRYAPHNMSLDEGSSGRGRAIRYPPPMPDRPSCPRHPVYDEGRTVLEVIGQLLALTCTKQIVVVDDGSTDDTAVRLAPRSTTRRPGRRHDQNRGKGAGAPDRLRTGPRTRSWPCRTPISSTIPGRPAALMHADLDGRPTWSTGLRLSG